MLALRIAVLGGVTAFVAAGCSATLVERPPRVARVVSETEPTCTHSRSLPRLDLAFSAAYAVAATAVATGVLPIRAAPGPRPRPAAFGASRSSASAMEPGAVFHVV